MSYDSVMSLDEFDLRRYDFEYAQIRRLTFHEQRQEIDLVIDCPELRLFRAERLHRLFFRFLGVSDVAGGLYSYVQKQLAESAEVVAELLVKGDDLILYVEIDHIRNVCLKDNVCRFYLGAEDEIFEFSYQSGVFRQLITSE